MPNSPFPVDDRYYRDPAFRTLVDMLEHQIQQANYTPTELREAVILACCHFEERRFRRHIIPLRSLDAIEPMPSRDQWRY